MESKVVWNKMFLELITKGSAVSTGLGYKLELELAQRNSFSLDEKFGTTPMHASLRKKIVLS